jgi:hypothetical protein
LSEDSFDAKSLAMRELLDSYGKKPKPKYVEDITRVDGLRYIITYLKKQGNADRTRWNKFIHLRQFLTEYDHNVFKRGDAPKYGLRDPEAFAERRSLELFRQVLSLSARAVFSVPLKHDVAPIFLYTGEQIEERVAKAGEHSDQSRG